MRMAVFSDIHGNLEAMEAFLDHVMQQRIDRFICLGDLVGYGASPGECIHLVKRLPNIVTILGNHDAAVLWEESPYIMNDAAKEAVLWTMDKIDESDKKFLTSLPLTHRFNRLNFSHANPTDPMGWGYVNNRKTAVRSCRHCKDKIMFVGHTHQPLVATRKNYFQMKFEEPVMDVPIKIDGTRQQIFNCGSIGQPRTGSAFVNYLIFDSSRNSITYHAIPYDYELASRKIIEGGLPGSLAERLRKGV